MGGSPAVFFGLIAASIVSSFISKIYTTASLRGEPPTLT
jgi:hypothetical protein